MMKSRHLILCAVLAVAGCGALYAQMPPVPAPDQLALLKSSDPKLAANKKLVFDMYRAIVQGGHTEMAEQYFTPEYIQHNPNVASGRDALVKYIKQTRPAVPLKPLLDFPVIAVMAEGDLVTIAVVSWADDPEKPGQRYANTHFDMYRIQNGKIAEHWDHVAKSQAAQHFNPNVETREKKSASGK